MKDENLQQSPTTTVERERKETRFNLDATTWRVDPVRGSDDVYVSVWTENHSHLVTVRMTPDQYQKFCGDLAAAAEVTSE